MSSEDINSQTIPEELAETSDEISTVGSYLGYSWFILTGNPLTLIGSLIVLIFTLVAILAPVIAPYGATEIIIADRFQPPNLAHLMGTDHLGMDIFSRIVYATQVDLVIALSGVLLGMVIGVPLGAIIGYSPRVIDEIVMRVIDSINAFPVFILAMGVAAAMGPGVKNVILVVGFVTFPSYLRLVRGEVLSLKQRQFIEAARGVGNSPVRIVFIHLLPNAITPALVLASLNTAHSILIAAGLSFIGVGVPLPTPEWGLMVKIGTRYLPTGEWWISFFPGLAIATVVLGLNLVGDSLQDILDPRRRFR